MRPLVEAYEGGPAWCGWEYSWSLGDNSSKNFLFYGVKTSFNEEKDPPGRGPPEMT